MHTYSLMSIWDAKIDISVYEENQEIYKAEKSKSLPWKNTYFLNTMGTVRSYYTLLRKDKETTY